MRRRLPAGGLTDLSRDRRGSVMVEFAIVALPFFALILGILQIALVFFAQQLLETASEKSVRQLMTGQVQTSGMTQAQFKTLVCSNLPSFMTCDNVILDVRSATDFSAADTSRPTITYDTKGNPTNTTFAPGGSGEITVAKVMYVWGGQKGLMGLDLSTMANGSRLLVATTVFKAESY